MIKRFRFFTRGRQAHPDDVVAGAGELMSASATAPVEARPLRIVLCPTMIELTGAEPRHDAVGIDWFSDPDHLRRFEAWTLDPDPVDNVVVVAREHALRGAQWLHTRWHDRGPKFKHMAVAQRADGLTPAEFLDRWRNHAGSVQRPGAAPVRIPDTARGQAYLQNHPIPRTTGEWPYDAVNEVYFDTVDDLRSRIEWFERNLPSDQSDDLFGDSWLIAVREEIVLG